MPVDVIVITNGTSFSEDVLKSVWETAQKLFHEYGLEVYVIPYVSKDSKVMIVVNDVEFVVSRKLTHEEIEDLILTACEGEGKGREIALVGTVISDWSEFGSAQIAF